MPACPSGAHPAPEDRRADRLRGSCGRLRLRGDGPLPDPGPRTRSRLYLMVLPEVRRADRAPRGPLAALLLIPDRPVLPDDGENGARR